MTLTLPLGSDRKLRLSWLTLLIAVLFTFNALPFLAPVFMKIGWEGAGRAIYLLYWPLCHQMAQRSFFLFGPQGFQMYTLAEIPVNASGPLGELALKQFLGAQAMGWKVAWSDRMVTFYGGPLVAAVAYALARRRGPVKPWPVWLIGLMLLPMMLDGGTHMISDMLYDIGQGFRDSNQWLAALTRNALPTWFYQGDALGSFNSWMRLSTGLLFGFGIGWLLLTMLGASASYSQRLDELNTESREALAAFSARQPMEQNSD